MVCAASCALWFLRRGCAHHCGRPQHAVEPVEGWRLPALASGDALLPLFEIEPTGPKKVVRLATKRLNLFIEGGRVLRNVHCAAVLDRRRRGSFDPKPRYAGLEPLNDLPPQADKHDHGV